MTTRASSAHRSSGAFAVAVAVAACWAATWLCGCDGIGRALVDSKPIPRSGPGCDFTDLPKCDDPPLEFTLDGGLPLGAAPIDLTQCFGALPPCLGDGADPDAGSAPTEACAPSETVDALDHALRDCESMRVVIDADAGPALAREPNLSSVSLAIESALPVELTLDRAALQHVFIHLEGAITLRISHAITFDDVGITGSVNAGGAPRIELVEVVSTLLAIGEPERAFPGKVDIRRSKLDDANVRADTINFDSVRVDHSSIESRNTFAAGSTLTTVQLALGYATFSATQLSAVHVDTCTGLVLISGGLAGSEVAACSDEPLRVYNTNVSKSVVDGAIDSDGSTWQGVRFGARAPTEILGWGTRLAQVAFCDQSRFVRFGSDANFLNCSSCIEGVLEEPACVFQGGVLKASANTCPELEANEDWCTGETPQRPRP